MQHSVFTSKIQRKKLVAGIIVIILFQAVVCADFAWGGEIIYAQHAYIQDSTLSPKINIDIQPLQSVFSELSGFDINKNILKGKNVLFVSFRIVFDEQLGGNSALDGVSLEIQEWTAVFEGMGANVHYFSGENKVPDSASNEEMQEAHFKEERLQKLLNEQIFQRGFLEKQDIEEIRQIKQLIKERLKRYVSKNEIDLIVSENVHSYPGNPALSRAVSEVLTEVSQGKEIKLIKHSHDFYWERERFIVVPGENLDTYLRKMVNGTTERNSSTVVINSTQKRYLELLKEKFKEDFNEVDVTVAPNVRDFDNPPVIDQVQLKEFLNYFKINKDNEYLVLLPMRPIERKNLELAFEQIEKMMQKLSKTKDKKVKVMLTHPSGDEGKSYWENLKADARKRGIYLIDAGDSNENSRARKFNLATAYAASDIVLYPSKLEGYGNVVPEAMYYKKPFAIYPYLIYQRDIKPLGVKCVETETASDEVIEEIIKLLQSPQKVKEMVEHNYEVGRRYLSRTVLRKILTSTIEKLFSISAHRQKAESSKIRGLIEQAI